MSIEIIYHDAACIAINKPQGLLSVPGIGPDKQDCAIARLLEIEPEAKVVHRLDCYTSGVMVFAIGIDMQRAFSKLFHDRLMKKEYVAVVRDWFDEDEGVVKFPIRCDIDNRPVQIVDYEHGKPAITYWEVMERKPGKIRLLLKPETGRTHQLRVHCAALEHPIIGDGLYGNDPQPEKRMLLHADRLMFNHPVTQQPVTIHAPCEF